MSKWIVFNKQKPIKIYFIQFIVLYNITKIRIKFYLGMFKNVFDAKELIDCWLILYTPKNKQIFASRSKHNMLNFM